MTPLTRTSLTARALGLAAPLVAARAVGAQELGVVFSVDGHGSTVGLVDSRLGVAITEGDLLLPGATPGTPAFGPLPTPGIRVKGGSPGFGAPHLGLSGHAMCYGHAGGTPCVIEVDALASGTANALQPGQPLLSRVFFSTDQLAAGNGTSAFPGITSEGPAGDLAADVLVDLGLGQLPAPPWSAAHPGCVAVLDGDGKASSSGAKQVGIGLRESTALPDNLDALCFLAWPVGEPLPPIPPSGLFSSLEGGLIDPRSGQPGSNTASFHGFRGADVLHHAAANSPPVVYAPAGVLGLDLFGPGSDDLDALVVAENGSPGFQVSSQPFDWSGGATDMLLFSVRVGSAVVGEPDSRFGLPIEPGDVLTAPQSGGLSPFPAIFIAAENLGLAVGDPLRGGGAPFGDELDALELSSTPAIDCNGNGRDDAVDIALGSSADVNGNGVPDECERNTTGFCYCAPSPGGPGGPCGNHFAGGGCANSGGVGAWIQASGTTSASGDDLVLHTHGLPAFVSGMTFTSASVTLPTPFYDGRKCVGAPVSRFQLKSSGAGGVITVGPGLAAFSYSHFPAANWIANGATLAFQTWYRDAGGPCAQHSNLSSAMRATFTP